ncbi:MAG: GspE/PulE family protein [Desulfobacteraceae bacterium]|nr:GspE/PulE family protein [Desulfobacteraceae bacterium]
MLKKLQPINKLESHFNELKSEVEYHTRLQNITNKIHAANNLDEILIDLKNDITTLFETERITVYVVDGVKRELISRFKSGIEITEIRIPISKSSIAGYSCYFQKVVNISDVYNEKELFAIDKELTFDVSWDEKTGYKTRQMLVCPIVFKKYLLGAIQLINRTDNNQFTTEDEKSVRNLAKTIGIALYNQKRMAKGSRNNKFDYLLENNLLTQKELNRAITESRKHKEPIEAMLMREYNIPKIEIGRALSKYYKVPFVQFSHNHPIPGELLKGLKVPFMRSNDWVPLRQEDGMPIIAVDDPNGIKKIDDINALFPGKTLRICVALKEDIQKFISLFVQDEKELSAINQMVSKLNEEKIQLDEIESSVDEEDRTIVQLVNKIITDAYTRGASDIHIEPNPGRQNTQVRIRVDGSCNLHQTIPFDYKKAVVSRIKIMADLDIAEKRTPQDGKIKFNKFGGKDIELRVATIPTQGDLEDVVLRLLPAGDPVSLEDIGFTDKNLTRFLSVITQPYGIIFVCGPTGSGKTTTLHSALRHINKTETKIWTAEDPVEITQKGLRQVQVKPKIGFDFAAAMRAFLRADPDVIMVGEMRDKETTSIGIEASLTGHLVFSTLHTNSAPESITRLLDMGMDPFNFADAVLCILAQRLVKTLCPDCKQGASVTKSDYIELVREYGPAEFEKTVNLPYSKNIKLYRAKGCAKCGGTGYRGRMGIHELLMGTDNMKKLIQSKAEMEKIRALSIAEGMTTLKQDGIVKVFKGHTDLLQVRKVCIK